MAGPSSGWFCTVNGATPSSSSHSARRLEEKEVTVHFLDPNVDGLPRRMSVKAPVGSTLVDVAKEHGVDIHAACGQKLQCATCHVILEQPFFERLQGPGVREEDLLDSTFTLTDTSRLGCQVRLTEELDGIQCTLPDSGAKGNVRMTLEMPRPKVQMQLPGAPAVAPSVKRGGTAQPTVEELLKRQEALSARLEAHLREIQAKAARKPEETNASDNSGQSAEEEKEDLSKLKAELQKTRVETEKLGRKARFEDVIGLAAAKEAIKEALFLKAH
ncbi:2Fe-2S ferredoxin (Adrenodoxin-like protein) [Durusdinium trenchii]|uniref:2Fe-2S ferredoxin (Adrenodoxin-like protein) n=1 Tax=Durusdinium trenchii TaxID=1381693 RepID=A0ABP0P232_9DINO